MTVCFRSVRIVVELSIRIDSWFINEDVSQVMPKRAHSGEVKVLEVKRNRSRNSKSKFMTLGEAATNCRGSEVVEAASAAITTQAPISSLVVREESAKLTAASKIAARITLVPACEMETRDTKVKPLTTTPRNGAMTAASPAPTSRHR